MAEQNGLSSLRHESGQKIGERLGVIMKDPQRLTWISKLIVSKPTVFYVWYIYIYTYVYHKDQRFMQLIYTIVPWILCEKESSLAEPLICR